ncbi:MAG: phosphoribosyltransferase [Actinomycetota bacterium]
MGDEPMVSRAFQDRRDAGQQLARRLLGLSIWDPLVMGIARGGVIVAAEVAHVLDAPLDVLIVKKIGAPKAPEHIIGAAGEDEVMVFDWPAVDLFKVRAHPLRLAVEAVQSRVRDEIDHLRDGRAPIPLEGRTVLVIDDCLEAGVCARAAGEIIHRRGAAHAVLAVPAGLAEAVGRLQSEYDDVITILSAPDSESLALTYRARAPLTDGEVVAVLRRASLLGPLRRDAG